MLHAMTELSREPLVLKGLLRCKALRDQRLHQAAHVPHQLLPHCCLSLLHRHPYLLHVGAVCVADVLIQC